jgi:putative hydrolase of the HAD superfamily
MRAILLDLDDTLLDDRRATRLGLDAFLGFHRPSDRNRDELLTAWRTIAARHWQRYEAGEISFLEQRRCRVREFLGRQLTDEEADAAVQPYLTAYQQAWRLLPGVAQLLDRTRHIPKVIITNGERDQQLRKLAAAGLADHVIGVVTPGDCGHAKPHERIFLAAVAMLGVEPFECLMIGDDSVRDIEPARKLGMQCLLVEAGSEERVFSCLAFDD